MKIKDRFEFKNKAPILTFTADTLVYEAVHAMSEKNYGASVIVDKNNKPIGIVTERDFMRRLLDKGLDPKKTKLSEIMTSNLKVAKADDYLVDWIRQMSNERFRHVPVVDDQGKLINIMSQGDFVSYTWPQLINRTKDEMVSTISSKYQLFTLIAAVMVYTLLMIMIFRS